MTISHHPRGTVTGSPVNVRPVTSDTTPKPARKKKRAGDDLFIRARQSATSPAHVELRTNLFHRRTRPAYHATVLLMASQRAMLLLPSGPAVLSVCELNQPTERMQ